MNISCILATPHSVWLDGIGSETGIVGLPPAVFQPDHRGFAPEYGAYRYMWRVRRIRASIGEAPGWVTRET